MARVSLITPEQASPETADILRKTAAGPGNFTRALAHRPELLKNFLAFYGSVGKSLDKRLYELIYIRVSMLNRCDYCMQHHLASSKKSGVTPQDWSALKAGSSPFSAAEQAALAYAEKATRGPADSVGNEVEALKKHFSEEQVVDIVSLVALANLTNRMTAPLGVELEMAAQAV